MKNLILALSLISLQLPLHADTFIRTEFLASAQNFDGAPKSFNFSLDGMAAVSAAGGAGGAAIEAFFKNASEERALLAQITKEHVVHREQSHEVNFLIRTRGGLNSHLPVVDEVNLRLEKHSRLRDEASLKVKTLTGQLEKLRKDFWKNAAFSAMKGAGLCAAATVGVQVLGQEFPGTPSVVIGAGSAMSANLVWQAFRLMTGRASAFCGSGLGIAATAGAASALLLDGYRRFIN